MAVALDPKQLVPFEELLMTQVVQQEALTRLLVERKISTSSAVKTGHCSLKKRYDFS